MESIFSISIDLSHIEEGLILSIDSKNGATIFNITDADENHEAPIQLVEGCYYDYKFNNPYFHFLKDQIIQPHSRDKNLGTVSPNIYVGTLSLPVYKSNQEVGKVELEVQSIKSDYRQDYRDMLELITEKCTGLLLQSDSPVHHYFVPDYFKDNEALYQRFVFINSVLNTDEFKEAVHRVLSFPVTKWEEIHETRKIGQIRRLKNSNIRELITGRNRIRVPENHALCSIGFDTVPDKLNLILKTDSIDTPENQFVKHALDVFHKFCIDINKAAKKNGRLFNESHNLANELESILQHAIFKKVSWPKTLNLNSPVIQRKEGYREILRVWLMFDLAAKLIWKGGEDIYRGGKKDVAVLYEYWLFFKLLDLFQSIFNIEPEGINSLIQKTKDGLNLQIRQGRHTALRGIFDKGNRKLNVRFNYNRSFIGRKNYPLSGSWTTTLRPDYTLSIWPVGITEDEAEMQELIVHINFDAKYKISNPEELITRKVTAHGESSLVLISKAVLKDIVPELKDEEWEKLKSLFISKGIGKLTDYFPEKDVLKIISELSAECEGHIKSLFPYIADKLIDYVAQILLSEEKTENREGIYKNADLLKMHAYRDAIRRSGGSYILYPGNKSLKLKGFHEIIPGLGAFPVKPSKTETGITELKEFIFEVIDHFINRASQRERMAFKVYDVHKDQPNELKEPFPEPYGNNRDLIPDETYVLVGYFKNQEHFDWISSKGLYNIRVDERDGSLPLTFKELSSRYLLLHTKNFEYTGELWEIIGDGPKVYSKEKMNAEDYQTENSYLVFRVRKSEVNEFKNMRWAFKELPGFDDSGSRGAPFIVTLTQLMKTTVKE